MLINLINNAFTIMSVRRHGGVSDVGRVCRPLLQGRHCAFSARGRRGWMEDSWPRWPTERDPIMFSIATWPNRRQISQISLTCMRLAAQQLHFKSNPLVPLEGTYSDKPCFNWRNKVVPYFLEIVGVALENLLQRQKDTLSWQQRTFGLRPRSVLFTPNQCASR